jgi:DNA primase
MAGLIPQPFIDDLLNRTDIVELIDGYVPLKKRGNSHIACCPFHNEKNPSFNVVAKKQFYHCFGCGASGNAISFAMEYMSLGFVEAVENLAARIGMEAPREGQTVSPRVSPTLYDLMSKVTTFYQHTLKTAGQPAVEYLKKRGISGQVASLYGLGYAPSGWHTLEHQFRQDKKELITTGMLIEKDEGGTYDRYRHRITFPIHDRNGRIIGFGGRAIDDDQKPKYLNSPETILFQKNRELYGLHAAIQKEHSRPYIIVVEGYMDVIALAQHGVDNAVATLGTATSTYHIQLLSKHTKKIVFCFDGDQAGQKAAWRALESSLQSLNAGLEASFCFLPNGHDPDSLIREQGREGFLKHIADATPFSQFFFANLTKDMDTSSLAGKSQLINIAKPYLIKMNDGPYRQLLIEELSRMSRLDTHRIQQLIEEKTEDKLIEVSVNIERTPTRVAVALLLQNPELYSNCKALLENIELDEAKHSVLKKLMIQINNNPEIRTAGLVESWRDKPLFNALNKLAAWEHQVPDFELKKEFVDIILFLSKQNHEKKIAHLLDKSRNEGLTDMERRELQDLLKQKHQHANDENANLE